MRNLAQYPVTIDECMTILDDIKQNSSPRVTGLIGDLTPVCLGYMYEYLAVNSSNFTKFLESKQIDGNHKY